MTKLSINVLQPPFISPGRSVHVFQKSYENEFAEKFYILQVAEFLQISY